MSIEDNLLRFEGLDPDKINQGLTDASVLLGVVKSELGRVKAMAETAQKLAEDFNHLVSIYEAQEGRIERLISTVQGQIAAYQAKQKQVNQGWR